MPIKEIETQIAQLQAQLKRQQQKAAKQGQYKKKPPKLKPTNIIKKDEKEEREHRNFLKKLNDITDPEDIVKEIYNYINAEKSPYSRKNFLQLINLSSKRVKEYIDKYFKEKEPKGISTTEYLKEFLKDYKNLRLINREIWKADLKDYLRNFINDLKKRGKEDTIPELLDEYNKNKDKPIDENNSILVKELVELQKNLEILPDLDIEKELKSRKSDIIKKSLIEVLDEHDAESPEKLLKKQKQADIKQHEIDTQRRKKHLEDVEDVGPPKIVDVKGETLWGKADLDHANKMVKKFEKKWSNALTDEERDASIKKLEEWKEVKKTIEKAVSFTKAPKATFVDEKAKVTFGSCKWHYIHKPWLKGKVKKTLIDLSGNQGENEEILTKYVRNIEDSSKLPFLSANNEELANLFCDSKAEIKQNGNSTIVTYPDGLNFNFKLKFIMNDKREIEQDEKIFQQQVDFMDTKFLSEDRLINKWLSKNLSEFDHSIKNKIKDTSERELLESLNKNDDLFENKVSPPTKEKKENAKQIVEAVFEKNKNNPLHDYLDNITEFLVVLSDEVADTSNMFRKRLHLKYYTPEVLASLSLQEKLPEVFSNPEVPVEEKRKIFEELEEFKVKKNKELTHSLYGSIHEGKRLGGDWVVTRRDDEKNVKSLEYAVSWNPGKDCSNGIPIVEDYELANYVDKVDGETYCFSITELKTQFEDGDFINKDTAREFDKEFVDYINKFSIDHLTKDDLKERKKIISPQLSPKYVEEIDLIPGLLEMLQDEINTLKGESKDVIKFQYNGVGPCENCIHCGKPGNDGTQLSFAYNSKQGKCKEMHFCSTHCFEECPEKCWKKVEM